MSCSARWRWPGTQKPHRSAEPLGGASAAPRRILFAWELGANFGHLSRDLPLARLCHGRGFEVVMVVGDLATTARLLVDEGVTLLQAPRLRPPAGRRRLPVNYADMLLREGYEDEVALAGALAGWRGLIELIRPSCLVFDHAPTALLAARSSELPALILGPGFEIPPAGDVLPSFRPEQDIPRATLRAAEELWLVRVNAVLAGVRATPLARLSELFAPERTWFTTFEELDPFAPRPQARYIGPVALMPAAREVAWQTRGAPRVFAYLRPSVPRVEQLLEALQGLGAEVLCVMPGIPDEWRSRFARLRCLDHPVDIATALGGADLVVCYGTHTVAQALLFGRPVLLVPQVIEQYLSGLAFERTGTGLMLREERSPQACSAALRRLLEESTFRAAAQEFARRHAGFRRDLAVEEQYAALEALCGRSR